MKENKLIKSLYPRFGIIIKHNKKFISNFLQANHSLLGIFKLTSIFEVKSSKWLTVTNVTFSILEITYIFLYYSIYQEITAPDKDFFKPLGSLI